MWFFSSRNLIVFSLFFVLLGYGSCTNSSTPKQQTRKQPKKEVPGADLSDSLEYEKHKQDSVLLVDAFDSAYQKTLNLFCVPVQELYLETALGTAHVIKGGNPKGKALVLLHGMNASSTMWYPNFSAFTPYYQVYAIDFLLEPNRSKSLKKSYSSEEIAAWYDAIFDQLKLKEVVLVGASRGGWLSVNYCLNFPSRVKKLVLLSPAQTFTWITPSSDLLANVSYSLLPSDKRLKSALAGLSADTSKLAPSFVTQFNLATEKSGLDRSIFVMRPFSSSELENLTMPVLLLIGDEDFINGRRSLKLAKRRLPNIEAEMINHAGHFLSVDQSKKVNRKILKFIN